MSFENCRVEVGSPKPVTVNHQTHWEFEIKLFENGQPSVPPEGQEIFRRFRDFEWLHKQLTTDVPGAVLATLPPKGSSTYLAQKAEIVDGSHTRGVIPELVQMRGKSLTNFMNALLVNPEVAAFEAATRHLQVFIAGSPDEFSLVKSPATNVHANAGGQRTEEAQSPVKKKSYFSFSAPTFADMKSKMTGSALRESVSSPVEEKSHEDLQCDAMMAETLKRQANLGKAEQCVGVLVQNGVDAANATNELSLSCIGLRSGGPENEENDDPIRTVFGELGGHCSATVAPATMDKAQRQVVALHDPLQKQILLLQATKDALGVRQKVKEQLVAATHQHKLRKEELQRHYDSAKMTDDKRAELEKRSDLAGEEVEKCQQRLVEVTARLLREHGRVSQERKSELKDVLFVWTKMHLVHCQQSQQDWQMFHENMTGTVFTPEEDNFEIPRPTPAAGGAAAVAPAAGAAAMPGGAGGGGGGAANFEDEVSV